MRRNDRPRETIVAVEEGHLVVKPKVIPLRIDSFLVELSNVRPILGDLLWSVLGRLRQHPLQRTAVRHELESRRSRCSTVPEVP